MDALAHTLDLKLRKWKPQTSKEVRDRVAEIIERADDVSLDLARSRTAEHEVLQLIDEPKPR